MGNCKPNGLTHGVGHGYDSLDGRRLVKRHRRPLRATFFTVEAALGAPRRSGLWAHADFLKLWADQTISQFGSQITFLALPLVAALLGATPLEMGVLSAVEMLPFLLVGLPAGVWVDRMPRRPILIAGDLGRALVLASIPLAFLLDALTIGQLYVVAFIAGTFTVFFDVAYMSFLPALVTREELVEGNSKLETTRAAAQIAGPGVAGTLIQLFSAPVAILVDSLSFLISAAFLLAVHTGEPAAVRRNPAGGVRAEIGEGLRYVFSQPLLRPIASATATFNLFSSATFALYILFAVEELALDAAVIGLIFAVGNVGALLGATAAGTATRLLGLGRSIIGAMVLCGLASFLVPLATPATAVALLVPSLVVSGIGNMVYNINQVSLRQAITPARLQGRMNATVRFMVWGTMPIGSLLGGTLGQWLGLRPAILLAAAGSASAFIWLIASPVRTLRVQPPPVEPG
ncbi:MAG: MFS transporter [Chloroflexi bacterium]|nr:MFS transporter [Chloroflexota bacterium]